MRKGRRVRSDRLGRGFLNRRKYIIEPCELSMHGVTNQGAASAREEVDAVAHLLQDYGYPPEVGFVLQRLLGALRQFEPLSVLLHGSAARGELTWWRDSAGRVRVASDIEMYITREDPFPQEGIRAVNSLAERLTEEMNAGGAKLFHIDLGFVSLKTLRRHPRTFRCWDTRTSGRTLLGVDVRAELPALDASTIDLRQLNEVPIHRLWEMVFRLPRPILSGGHSLRQDRVFAYVCGRQALDLTTWLLPHQGVLVPTFTGRVAAWEEVVAQGKMARYFSPTSTALLQECLEAKLHFRLRRPAAELHKDVLAGFRAGLRLLLDLDHEADDEALMREVLRQGRRHWNVETPRRRLYEGFLVWRHGLLPRHPIRAARWWWRQKRPQQVAFLLLMNAALAGLLSDSGDDSALSAAERLLSKLWHGFSGANGTTTDRFLAARRGYLDYLTRTSRWFAPRRAYLLSVIGETPEHPSSQEK